MKTDSSFLILWAKVFSTEIPEKKKNLNRRDSEICRMIDCLTLIYEHKLVESKTKN